MLTQRINKQFIIILVLLMAPITGICIDMYAPSLPAIATYFSTSASVSKLTITFCIVGFGIGQFFFGALVDSYGRKKPLIGGLLIFTLSSLITALSSNLYVLFVMRVFQGIGVAAASVSVKSINADVFSGKELTKITAYYAAIWSASPILAPIIGSYLQHYFGWQANFYAFTIVGIISLGLTSLLPETSTNYHPFSLISVLKNYISMLKHPTFLSGSISIGIGYSFLLLFSVIGPFFIIRNLQFTVVAYGHIAFIIGLMTFFGSLGTRYILIWYSASTICSAAITLITLASFAFLISSCFIKLNLYAYVIPIIIFELSESILYPGYFSSIMGLFPNRRGTASATVGIMLSIVPFIVSFTASLIPLYDMLPASIIYFTLCCILLLLYFSYMRPLLKRQ